MTRARVTVAAFAYAGLLAYLSFIPFQFHSLSIDEALRRFAQAPWLVIGPQGRADWVANLLMYLPFGALLAGAITPWPRRTLDWACVVVTLSSGLALALLVEFGQVFFPGRTVSWNDVAAEAVGTVLGGFVWTALGSHARDWWQSILHGGKRSANAALSAYVVAYLVLSFSPFDFVLSADELVQKFDSSLVGWWLAPAGCAAAPCALKLLLEAAAMAPLGWWWGARKGVRQASLSGAAVLGLAFGALIEVSQFALVSGVSQGASVVARGLGSLAGTALYAQRAALVQVDLRRWGRPIVFMGMLPYALAVAYVNGWFASAWIGSDAALLRIPDIRWLPFHYQYFSTEQAAIRSGLLHFALYAPIGAATWLWRYRRGPLRLSGAAVVAALVAFCAESGKLFLDGRHPDYTDVLIAAAAATLVAGLLRLAGLGGAEATRTGKESGPSAQRPLAADSRGTAMNAEASLSGRLFGAAMLALAAYSLLRFPVGQLPLAAVVFAYALLLARSPTAYLAILPAAAVVLDLAPWSGRFFWDEFDILLLITLGVRLLQQAPKAVVTVSVPRFVFAVFSASLLASTAASLSHGVSFDANAFSSYMSPLNALRVARGFLWAGALIWLVCRDVGAGRAVTGRLTRGLGFAVAALVAVAVAERLSLGDGSLSGVVRSAGLVSAEHVGGIYYDALLLLCLPFALQSMLRAENPGSRAAWAIVSVAGAGMILLTYTRSSWAALFLGALAFALVHFMQERIDRSHGRTSSGFWTRVSIVGVAGVFLLAGAYSPFLRERLKATGQDTDVRIAHWKSTLDMMRWTVPTTLLGMGPGSFPREYYLAHAADARLAAHRIIDAGAASPRVLLMTGGGGYFIDQRIKLASAAPVEISVTGRADPPARLAVGVCAKTLLYSSDCAWTYFELGRETRRLHATSPAVESAQYPSLPLHVFSLHNADGKTNLEVRRVSAVQSGRELLDNGDFSSGMDRWFIASDVHLAWRAKNAPLQVLFEQGILGVAAWGLLIGWIMLTLIRSRHESVAAISAAFVGLVAISMFDVPFDAPRFVALAGLVLAQIGTFDSRQKDVQRSAARDPSREHLP